MVGEGNRLGARVRALRRQRKMTQVQLAESLGISASYLNLIEHDRRPLPASLLIKLTQLLDVDLARFAADDGGRLRDDLMEAFADRLFDGMGLTNADVKELVNGSPTIAKAVLELYKSYQSARRAGSAPSEEAADHEAAPSEQVSDLLHRHGNHFPRLEEAASALWSEGKLDRNDIYRGLVAHLERVHGIQVRVVEVAAMEGAVKRYLPGRRVLMLSEILEPHSRNFQLAHHIGLLDHGAALDEVAAEEPLTTDDARALARVALSNYFAGALLMPYDSFLVAAKAVRYDIELLGHRFRTSFEQVCHRLTQLSRSGQEGVPFHFLRVDVAGNISKRFSGSGMHFARYAGACPRWNVFASFLTPGRIRVQVSRMPDGGAYFSVARTIQKGTGAYRSLRTVHAVELGCDVRHAKALVYADGVDLAHLDAAVPVGVTCRLCERVDCEQRAVPSVAHALSIDENVRGLSFFAPVKPPE